MAKIKVKFLRDNAKLPYKTHVTDAGYDLVACFVEETPTQVKVYTGIAIQPEDGYYIELVPRSSISKKRLELANSVGIIDNAYRGELIMVFNKVCSPSFSGSSYYPGVGEISSKFTVGEKVGQLIVRKQEYAEFDLVVELDDTTRGDGGFGSTGGK